MSIYYGAGYKYQLKDTYMQALPIRPSCNIQTEYIDLGNDGILVVRKGYAWDGPSGPTIDTKSFMRGSLVHDALYQLIREGHLGKQYRRDADAILKEICLQDGMCSVRAWWVYHAVRMFGASYSSPDVVPCRDVLRAP